MPDVRQLRFWVENYLSKQDVFIKAPVNPAIHKLLQALKSTKPQFFVDIADIVKELSGSFGALKTLGALSEQSASNSEAVKTQLGKIEDDDHQNQRIFFYYSKPRNLPPELLSEQSTMSADDPSYVKQVFEEGFPDQRQHTFIVMAEYLLYIEVIKAIQDKTKLNELLAAGFPRDVMHEILQMYPHRICEPDYIELLRLAIADADVKKIQMILAKNPFANIKMLKDIDKSDIDQIAQYRDLQDVLKEANALEIIIALIRGGFSLPLLTEILNNYPDAGGRILLNLLCNRTSIIGGAFYFNKEFAQKDIFLGFEPAIFLVGLLVALKFCAGAYCKVNLTLLCNYNVLAAREMETFENSLKILFSVHDCEDENCINHPSRLKHLTLILIYLARFPLSYSICEELVENNAFIICSALLGFSFAYSIFILPLAQAALVNEMLDSQQQSYDKARCELADILKQQEAEIPAAPVLFRNLSLQSLASAARDISESGVSRDSGLEGQFAAPQPY